MGQVVQRLGPQSSACVVEASGIPVLCVCIPWHSWLDQVNTWPKLSQPVSFPQRRDTEAVGDTESGPSHLHSNPKPHACCQLQRSRSKRFCEGSQCAKRKWTSCAGRKGGMRSHSPWGRESERHPAWHNSVSCEDHNLDSGRFLSSFGAKTKRQNHTLLEQACGDVFLTIKQFLAMTPHLSGRPTR